MWGIVEGSIIGAIKGDTRSVDYGSYELPTKAGLWKGYLQEICAGSDPLSFSRNSRLLRGAESYCWFITSLITRNYD